MLSLCQLGGTTKQILVFELFIVVFILTGTGEPVEEGCRWELLLVADDDDLASTGDRTERILGAHLTGFIDQQEVEKIWAPTSAYRDRA